MIENVARRIEGMLPSTCISTWREDVPLATPQELAQFQELLALASREGWRVLPLGFGSKTSWCHVPEHVDLVLSTRNLRGVVSYEPGDGTLSARAGSTLEELAASVAAGGHHLTPDVPCPSGATLGGVLASAQSGFDRLKHGPVRGHVLGMRVLLADGTLTKSGGQLVKNVTGYDLHRAYCGSHGTLCLIVEASLRLFPLPSAHATIEARYTSRDEALAAARETLRLCVHPLAVLVHDYGREPGRPWKLHVALAGRERVVEYETGEVLRTLEDAAVLEGAPARSAQHRARDLELDHGRFPALALATLPSLFGQVLAAAESSARSLGLAARTLAHPGIACAALDVGMADGSPLSAERAFALHDRLRGLDAALRWLAPPPELALRIDLFGAESAGLALMRRIKTSLDPRGVFATGRFHGRI